MSAVDVEYLHRWVGREQVVEDSLDPWKAVSLAATLDLDAAPAAGEDLPLCWQWLYFNVLPRARDVGMDGHPATGGFLPPTPFPRRMWAAGKLEVTRLPRLGEPAQRHSRIASIECKEGRSGALLFVNVDHHITQAGDPCILEQQNLVYRPMPEAAQALPAGKGPRLEAQWRRQIKADPVLLFRYSALTGNAHRIHYDREYAREVEFYPALVVHGPLQACLLGGLLSQQLPGTRVRSFTFRAQRPIFDTEDFSLCGYRDGRQVELWTETHDGFIGMIASVELA